MKSIRRSDMVHIFCLLSLICGIATGAFVPAFIGTGWLFWLLYDFVQDYERCQTELRRMAMDD